VFKRTAILAALAFLIVAPVARAARTSVPVQTPMSTAYWLGLAKAGVAAAERRWRAPGGWYYENLGGGGATPLVTIWGSVPLFEALDAIAIAQPSAANRAAVARFAAAAEGYWNPRRHAYAPYPHDVRPGDRIWFDDNGWWGLAFVNAYRATGNRRYLNDAMRALRFIAGQGWDRGQGGVWWNTAHPYKAGEALATGALLAVLLWQYEDSRFALHEATKLIGWANGLGFNQQRRLYSKSSLDSTVVDYIQAPLAYAQLDLCLHGEDAAGCATAQSVVDESLRAWGDDLAFSPQYDAPYLQWSLAIYALSGDRRLYDMAQVSATHAAALARSAAHTYLLGWHGQQLSSALADPGMLRTDAATVSVFAWLAATPPPA
jgi:hypothetical protein